MDTIKNIEYEILDFIIPFTVGINIKLWKRLCIRKNKLAHLLNKY